MAVRGTEDGRLQAGGQRIPATGCSCRKLREYFLAHPGEVVDWQVLRTVAGGITEWARRVRELRQHEGMNIETDKDNSALKPGQYRLVDAKALPVFSPKFSLEGSGFAFLTVCRTYGYLRLSCGKRRPCIVEGYGLYS